MHTVNLLTSLVENHHIVAYVVIYLGILLEGEFFLISAGILAHLGALDLWFVFLITLLGAFSKTFIGYALGEFLFKIFNHHRFFKYIQKRVYILFPSFKVKPFWSIFISKFIAGANNLVIIFSGYEKIDYKKFLKAEISATVIWAPLLLFLGYVFSYTALQISQEVGKFTMIVLALYLAFILFDKFVSWVYELFEETYEENI